ncbi:GAF domain-containing protein [Geobacter sp. FeAm09]|nr:GAF domain-containing protein [Geobacter sp. FeAm09]
MNVNKEEFFKEVTLRICSSLNINTALERVLEYLQKHLPFTQMFLYITETNLGGSRHIAQATDGTCTDKKFVSPPKEHWAWAREQQKPFILTHDDQDKNIHDVAPLIELKGNSILVVPLRIDDELIGFLVLRAKGENRFTPGQAELMGVVAKPFAIALVNAKAHETVVQHRDTLIDNNRFLNKESLSQANDDIIGGSSGLRNVMEMVQMVAPLNTTVLLLGETGTGKEVIANTIHLASPRSEGPFIKLNCGAIPENLIDDELFGHEKGAFTGAVAEKRGRFERASGGTLFLDEIGELPLQSQVRLLRVLQTRKISRVGGNGRFPSTCG